MIQLTENIWIGDSSDGKNLGALRFGAILNVAQDLRGWYGWPDVEYMQVGLIDGPGNPPSAYYAAVLALATLAKRQKTLVCCHTGGRSLAVAVMYLGITADRTWDELLELLHERVDIDLPVPHEAHRAAFAKINWRLLTSVIGD